MIIFLIFILLVSVSTSFSMRNHDTPIRKWPNQSYINKQDWPQPTPLEIEQLDTTFGFDKNGIEDKNNLINILIQPSMGYQKTLTILWNNHTHNNLFQALVSIYHEKFTNINELLPAQVNKIATPFTTINVRLLLMAGADPNYLTFPPDKHTLLMDAAIYKDSNACIDILRNGGNPNLTDSNNMTALGYAIEVWGYGRAEITVMTLLGVQSSLGFTADPNIRIYNPNWPGPDYATYEQLKEWGELFYLKFFNGYYMLDMTIIKALAQWYYLKIDDPSDIPTFKRIDRIKELNQVIQLFKQFDGKTSNKGTLTLKVKQALRIMEIVMGKSAEPLSDIVKQYLDGQTPEPTGDISIKHWFKNQFLKQHLVIRLNNK